MGESRITGGDIGNILRVSEVERVGFTEIYIIDKRDDGGDTRKRVAFFEFQTDGDLFYVQDNPWEVNREIELPYAVTADLLSNALEEEGLYLANARLLYPAVAIKFWSEAEEARVSGVMMGWGDLYRDKEVELGTFSPRRRINFDLPAPLN